MKIEEKRCQQHRKREAEVERVGEEKKKMVGGRTQQPCPMIYTQSASLLANHRSEGQARVTIALFNLNIRNQPTFISGSLLFFEVHILSVNPREDVLGLSAGSLPLDDTVVF